MGRIVHFIISAACAIFACSCVAGGASDISPTETARDEVVIRLFPEEGFDLPLEPILVGCNLWAPVGIRCVIEPDEAQANLWINVAPCPEQHWAAGTDYGQCGGPQAVISYKVGCWKLQQPGEVDEETGDTFEDRVASITAHEVGHALGIVRHVPYPRRQDPPGDCSGRAETLEHPDVGPLCGLAVMNSGGRRSPTLTDLDLLAFEMRDPTWSLYDTCQ